MKNRKQLISIISFLSLCLFSSGLWALSKDNSLTGRININTATIEEFALLPGIGLKKAADIIKLRSSIKKFRHTDDLLKVRGLGKKLFSRINPYLKLEGKSDLKKIALKKNK